MGVHHGQTVKFGMASYSSLVVCRDSQKGMCLTLEQT